MSSFSGFLQYLDDGPPRSDPSDAEAARLYLGNPRTSVVEIARLCGRSLPELYRALRRSNVEPCRLKANRHLVVQYGEAGYSPAQIAQLTNYTTRNVRYILAQTRATP